MASPLKIKMGIAGFAILVLCMIPLLENKFFAAVTVKRWGKLSWHDFQGIAPPFSSFDACISSAIYLEYDTNRSTYAAYAGQHNIGSWTKISDPNQDYLLNHEQYHFNITELHARKLNEYIAENPDGNEYLFNLRLSSINIDLSEVQDRYDTETQHSLIYGKQRSWEYQIDSLLALDSGWITDKFSGAKIYFTTAPELKKGITKNGNRYREYILRKYGMSFHIVSYQNELYNQDVLRRIVERYSHDSDNLKSMTYDTSGHIKKLFLTVLDSNGKRSYDHWMYEQKYIYNLVVTCPNDTKDTTTYSRIANSFLSSFSVVDTDSLWIAELEESGSAITRGRGTIHNRERPLNNGKFCLSIDKPEARGFYRGPFFRDDGALFLAYDNIVHADSVHQKDLLFLDEDVYFYTPRPGGQIYFVPAASLPNYKYRIDFGYIMNDQKVEECDIFYYQSVEIDPSQADGLGRRVAF